MPSSSHARNLSCHTVGIDLPDINNSVGNYVLNYSKFNLLPLTPEADSNADNDMGPMQLTSIND